MAKILSFPIIDEGIFFEKNKLLGRGKTHLTSGDFLANNALFFLTFKELNNLPHFSRFTGFLFQSLTNVWYIVTTSLMFPVAILSRFMFQKDTVGAARQRLYGTSSYIL